MQPPTRPVKVDQLDNLPLRSQNSLQTDNDLNVESSQLDSIVGSNMYPNDPLGGFQGHYIPFFELIDIMFNTVNLRDVLGGAAGFQMVATVTRHFVLRPWYVHNPLVLFCFVLVLRPLPRRGR
jgi:hypothetical protein